MSKAYKGKQCAYCSEDGVSSTADHVIAREFFPADLRHGIPKVPACAKCNGDKSELEHYLTAVMPFGGRLPASSAILETQVPPRLEKNKKLHRQLAAGQSQVWDNQNGILMPAMTLPVDSSKIEALFRFIVRGLMVHHWNVHLPKGHFIGAGMLSAEGEQFFGGMMSLNGQRVRGCLADGLFRYEGLQAVDRPDISFWRFLLYGGVVMSGDEQQPNQRASVIWGVTAKDRLPGVWD